MSTTRGALTMAWFFFVVCFVFILLWKFAAWVAGCVAAARDRESAKQRAEERARGERTTAAAA